MQVLYFLEKLRNPVTDVLFSLLTYLGEQSVFLLIALLMFWCIDKKRGYYLFLVSFIGLSINQFLKLLCRIPRPWVIDPSFPIVESARAEATGYSFPSGHTQNAINTYGSIAKTSHSRTVRILCIAIILLVSLSRLYLGVHTPWDVLASLIIGLILIFTMEPLMNKAANSPRMMRYILGILVALAAAFVLYAEGFPFPADIDTENLAEGQKNAWTILGCATAWFVVYEIDHRYLRFETAAPLPVQCCKLIFGAAIAILLKAILKTPLLTLFHGYAAAHALRYFLVVVFAGALWPLTFPFWNRLFIKIKARTAQSSSK